MYEIWISPSTTTDYYLVETTDDYGLADDLMVSWLLAGYLVTLRNKNLSN